MTQPEPVGVLTQVADPPRLRGVCIAEVEEPMSGVDEQGDRVSDELGREAVDHEAPALWAGRNREVGSEREDVATVVDAEQEPAGQFRQPWIGDQCAVEASEDLVEVGERRDDHVADPVVSERRQ